MLDPRTLKQLIRLMADHDLTELNLEDKDEKIHLRRASATTAAAASTAPVVPMAAAPVPTAASTPLAPAAPQAPEAPAATINSPMVGSFFLASGPDSPPFVKVGDHVTPNQVICIVEAMKVFNEIKAETSGTIERLLVENGQAVEFGQPLFAIRPD